MGYAMLKSKAVEIGSEILREVSILNYADMLPNEVNALNRLRQLGLELVASGIKPISDRDIELVNNIINCDKTMNRMFLDGELAGYSMHGANKALGRIGRTLSVASLLNDALTSPTLETVKDYREHSGFVRLALGIYQEQLKPLIDSPSDDRDNDTVETQSKR